MGKCIRVGIDLTAIWRRSTGIFRYSIELGRHLLLLPEDTCDIQYTYFFAREVHPAFQPLQELFATHLSPSQNELFNKQVWFPAILPRLRLDVMHYPTFPPPLLHISHPCTVMTFYDTSSWRYGEAQTLHGRFYFRTLLTQGTRTSSQIVTLSTHARSEIAHYLGQQYLPKISIAPGAVDAGFQMMLSDDLRDAVRVRYQLPACYFLTVATVEPRKNLPTLLAAYQQLRSELGDSCPALVIVGRQGWNCQDILRYMEHLRDSVHFLGFVPDKDLIALYQMALCLVFPSFYEGFGLPVLEAMSAGCPVISTESSSIPEVAGDAALLVDPRNASQMSDAMSQVYRDQELRTEMSRKGKIQSARYSWSHTAQLNREAYLKAARV